mmetsp:Transcript_8820/g.20783  ORF Transcript_8820/g.20783 Transcript_8820/m.20783 type:complete len:264 (+) Transcript_8820:340-1131(+)
MGLSVPNRSFPPPPPRRPEAPSARRHLPRCPSPFPPVTSPGPNPNFSSERIPLRPSGPTRPCSTAWSTACAIVTRGSCRSSSGARTTSSSAGFSTSGRGVVFSLPLRLRRAVTPDVTPKGSSPPSSPRGRCGRGKSKVENTKTTPGASYPPRRRPRLPPRGTIITTTASRPCTPPSSRLPTRTGPSRDSTTNPQGRRTPPPPTRTMLPTMASSALTCNNTPHESGQSGDRADTHDDLFYPPARFKTFCQVTIQRYRYLLRYLC